jgi:hypothetical protein
VKFTAFDRLAQLLLCLNVVRYALQALLAAACEATLPGYSNVPHICAIVAAKTAQNPAEIWKLAYNTCMAELGVLSNFKASCFNSNDAQLSLVLERYA